MGEGNLTSILDKELFYQKREWTAIINGFSMDELTQRVITENNDLKKQLLVFQQKIHRL